ncbi:MAG: hypothetical protein ACTSVW_04005 [Candidatus Njordarchaeales archaeon]
MTNFNYFIFIKTIINNKFYDIISDIKRKINYKDEELYKFIIDLIMQVVNNKTIYTQRNLEMDVQWRDTIKAFREYLDTIEDITNRYIASIYKLYRDVLDGLRAEITSSNVCYVILCDALSIIEAIYLVLAHEKNFRYATTLINPGGNTETYKYLASLITDEQFESLTLPVISRYVKRFLNAKDCIVFRDIDETVHQIEKGEVDSSFLLRILYRNASRLYNKIKNLIDIYDASVVLMSDHGYDIVHLYNDKYSLKHSWKGVKSISNLAPVIIWR